MRNIFIIILSHLCLTILSGQTQFNYAGYQLTSTTYSVEPRVYHVEPASSDDSEAVTVFKKYFNPTSYEAFRSMFLPEDWNGMTAESFTSWQQKLKMNPLELQFAIQLQDGQQHKYLVLIYVVHQTYFDIPSCKALKYVNGTWKHRNLDKSGTTLILERIGMMQPAFLQQKLNAKETTVSLGADVESQVRNQIEKFNRSDLEDELRKALITFNISETDINAAIPLFHSPDKNAMLTFLSTSYKFDRGELMDEINKQVGFEYYKYFRQPNTANR